MRYRDVINAVEWERGAAVARQYQHQRRDITARAAFLVNLHRPTENPQHHDLTDVEEFLHGYYNAIIEQLDAEISCLRSANTYATLRADKAEEILSAYKSRKSRSERGRKRTTTNR